MFYKFEDISAIEVELTSYCNSHCGACHRNKNGGELADHVTLEHMSWETWSHLLNYENIKHIKSFNFDGNVGDACVHPNFIEYLEALAEVRPDLNIRISTNGGARSVKFWRELALCLQKFSSHRLTFSVDGLEDTNHLYRRGVIWERLIKNIKAFNDAGGDSRWRCLIFDHNKHQIEETQALAEKLGCSLFMTYRNRQSPIKQVAHKTFAETTLTSPPLEEFEKKYKVSKRFKKITKPYVEKTISSSLFDCPFGNKGTISIDQLGFAWPCCFTSTSEEPYFPVKEYKKFCNINESSLFKISQFFQNDLKAAWENDSYTICKTCLHKFSPPTKMKLNEKSS